MPSHVGTIPTLHQGFTIMMWLFNHTEYTFPKGFSIVSLSPQPRSNRNHAPVGMLLSGKVPSRVKI